MLKMAHKVAVVTGAAGGLGTACALALAGEGASLALNYLDVGDARATCQALASQLRAEYACRVTLHAADISQEGAVQKMAEDILAQHGQVDVLVNNAGISHNALFWKFPASAWEKVLAVNLSGAFYCAKAFAPAMLSQGGGRIINISSVVGLQGASGTVAYAASKAGLLGMSKTMAHELAGHNITVNCIAPGYMDAGIIKEVPEKYKQSHVLPAIPMGRLGSAQDIARAVLFLAGEDGAYITGEVLRVDGGLGM